MEEVTLTSMLKVLDKDVSSGIEKKLKKLSRKKALEKPLDKNKADQLERKAAYNLVNKEVSKWDPIVDKNRRAKQLKFPLDQEADTLPSAAEYLADLEAHNDLEQAVKDIIDKNSIKVPTTEQISEAERKYEKAIGTDEAQERHRELQRMRVLLGSYAAKMRRQKAIKSKSYRKILKRERLRNHMKKVETDKDALMDEIERLHRLRAQERASLRHKNLGKWAKHAKFRAKYDEDARRAMMEQIGIAEKNLERPNPVSDDSDEIDDSAGESETEQSEDDEQMTDKFKVAPSKQISDERPLLRVTREIEDDQEEQRELMREAFQDDDVVSEFKKAKEQLVDEEQPKATDTFLPGWNDWAGPGTKEVSKRKRKKYIIKPKKIHRKDEKLDNVIISEQANDKIQDFMVSRVPRNMKAAQFEKHLLEPTSATFINQSKHREKIMPRIRTRLGARVEPMSKSRSQVSHLNWA